MDYRKSTRRVTITFPPTVYAHGLLQIYNFLPKRSHGRLERIPHREVAGLSFVFSVTAFEKFLDPDEIVCIEKSLLMLLLLLLLL